MRMGLRSRLIAAFILIISIPVLTGVATYVLMAVKFNDKGHLTVNTIRVLTNGIMLHVERNYHSVDKQEFFQDIEPKLLKIGSKLRIIDVSGRVVYDSEDRGVYGRKLYVNIRDSIQYDANFQSGNLGFVRIALPVIVQDKLAANAVFVIPSQYIVEGLNPETLAVMLSPVVFGLLCFVLLMLLLTWKLSRDILVPLEGLNKAAGEIARGNLEVEIRYPKESEVGKFCRAFDSMRQELKDSLERQATYESAHKELIASISHDLRTPTASIKAYVEGLQDGIAKDPAAMSRYLSVIRKKVDAVSGLIEDLFEHSQAELGKLRMNMAEQYSRKLLNDILEPVKVQFEKSHVTFSVEGELPDMLIHVDAIRLEQVILNLITNAAKYTPEGGHITFRAADEDQCLYASNTDTGMGISQEDMPHIFESFYRGDKSRSRSSGGAGLGLSICKYIVEAHGGRIFVRSTPDRGSTFAFTIPKV